MTEYTANATDADGANDVLGNAFHVYKPSEQLASYRFYGPNHVSNMDEANGDDVLVNYVFDYSGRTICSYETDNTKSEVIGSSAASYTQNSGTSGKNNRLTGAGAMGVSKPAVTTDGGFEYLALAKSVGNAEIKTATATDNKHAHTGRKSLGITLSNTNSTGAGYVKATLEAGQTYTVSSYVLNCTAENWNPNTSYGQIKILNSSGAQTSSSEKFTTQTNSSIEKGWERVSYTFTPEQSGSYYIGMEAGGFTGTYYVDDVQIEKGELAGPTNLVQGGKPTSASRWSLNGASYDGSTASPFGAGVVKMIGSPSANRSAVQNVPIYDNEPGTYILSGWGKASAVGSTEREYNGSKPYFGLLAAISYVNADGSVTGYTEWHYVPFNKDYADWQYASGVIIPKQEKAVNGIQVYAFYTSNANTAYFDNISLVREPCSSYSYDDKGNPVSAKEGGAKTKCEYQSGTSILTKYTASTGVVTNFTYESGTHNLKTTTSAGITSANTYNDMGLVTSTKSTGKEYWYQETTSVYDGYGNKTSSTDVNGITTTNTYNNHFLTKTKTGDMPLQEYRYNVIDGRMNQTFMSGYAIQHYLYGNGQLSDLSRKGKTSAGDFWQSYHFEYDSFGNMTRIGVSSANKDNADDVKPANYRTLASYAYEPGVNNGRLKTMTYGNGQTVNYEYDIFDRTTKETYNNGVAYNYAYDASGALAKQWSSTGEEYRYEYDSLGRLIRSSEYNGGTFAQRTEHIYDESDRLVRQAWYNGSGATSQTYDYSETNGLLTKLDVYFPGNTYNATPNAANNPSVGIAYTYSGINMLTDKTISSGGRTVYSKHYDYYVFHPANNTELNATANQVKKLSYGGGLSDLTRQYTYDARGNIASEANGSGAVLYKYTYDGQNQLTKVTNGSDTELYSYTYDTAGNIRTKTDGSTTHNYTYGDAQWRDLLTKYDGQTITYDNAGNPLNYYNGSDYTFEWTQGRRLATAVKGSTSVSYDYDMAGVRSSKTVGGTTYNYDTLSGKVMRQSWGNNVIDFVYDENNQPFAFKYNGTVYYYVLNVQGDVIGLLNANGAIAAKYTYDPWGKVTVQSSNGTANTSSAFIGNINPLRYRGYYFDADTGLYYLQSRYYDPAIGRFINADTYTTTDADGLLSTNMFAYCENNPVMGVDPTGEWVHIAIGAAIGAISSVATSYLSSKATGRDYSLLDAVVDAVSGAASGALAATGVGVLGQTVGNAAIGVAKGLVGGETSVSEIVENAIEGGVGGIIGGKGASYGNAKSITRSGEQLVKRIFKYKDPVKIAYGHYKKTAHRQGKEFVLKALWKSARNVSAYNFVGGLFR